MDSNLVPEVKMDSADVLNDKKDDLPFSNSGECTDEVVLVFDDEEKLYVSENFLSYASPVFKAMFHHDCKEETKEVDMKGKDREDFQEFLLCLHPAVQKPINCKYIYIQEIKVSIYLSNCLVLVR